MDGIKNKPKYSLNMQAIDVCIIFSLAALIGSRFSGLGAIAYQNLYQALLYPTRFNKDIFIQNTYYQDSSLFFNLVELTGLSPDNDYIGFAVHVIFSVLALYFAFRIISDFTPIKNLTHQLMAVLALSTIDHFLLIDTFPSIIYYGYSFTTGYGHALMFPLIYFTLQKRTFIVALLSSLIFLISAKAGIMPISVCWAFLFIFHWRTERFKLLSVAVPLVTVLAMSGNVPVPHDYDLRMTMLKNAVDRSREENVLHMQPHIFKCLLLASIPTFFLLLFNRFSGWVFPQEKAKEAPSLGGIDKFLYLTFFFGVCLIAVGWAYGAFLYKIYPDPRLIMLSPPRALALYQWSFALLLIIRMMQSQFHMLIKVAFLTGLMYFDFKYNSYKPVELGLTLWGFVGLCTAYHLLKSLTPLRLKKVSAFFQKFALKEQSTQWLFIFFALPSIILSFNVYALSYYSANQNNKIHKWYSTLNDFPEMENAAISLRQCDDILLLGLLKSNDSEKIRVSTYVNYLGIQSKYFGDLFTLVFAPKYHDIAQDRQQIVERAINELDQKQTLPTDIVKRFKQDHLNILTNLDPDQYLFTDSRVEPMGRNVWMVSYDESPLNCHGQE